MLANVVWFGPEQQCNSYFPTDAAAITTSQVYSTSGCIEPVTNQWGLTFYNISYMIHILIQSMHIYGYLFISMHIDPVHTSPYESPEPCQVFLDCARRAEKDVGTAPAGWRFWRNQVCSFDFSNQSRCFICGDRWVHVIFTCYFVCTGAHMYLLFLVGIWQKTCQYT